MMPLSVSHTIYPTIYRRVSDVISRISRISKKCANKAPFLQPLSHLLVNRVFRVNDPVGKWEMGGKRAENEPTNHRTGVF